MLRAIILWGLVCSGAGAATVTVHMSNFEFKPKEITVAAGSTVEWINDGGRHNLKADDGSFSSEDVVTGKSFSHVFAKPGKYPYYCGNHGVKGGKAMAGVVTVTP
jgi:plastocyanin